MEADARTEPARLPTGVPGLDTVLSGGLTAGGVFIVQGSPGAGKTILANQICFHHAAQGKHALYVTLLAESHDRLLRHLRTLDFFDGSKIPDSMYYISGFDILSREGVKGILQLLRAETRARGASLIVLDGLFAAEESAASEGDYRAFINDLSTLAGLLGCTILLLTNRDRGRNSAEFTMVDGWLELDVEDLDYRSFRYCLVHKYRGSDFISGRHSVTISSKGICLLPRLEATPTARMRTDVIPGSHKTGIDALDRMIGGGLPFGSSTLLIGPSGVGKTTMGLHFIAQSTSAEPGMIFGLYESPDQLKCKAALLGMDLEGLERSGAVEIVWHSATENLLDGLAYQLLEAVRRHKPRRLFLDGIDAFRQSTLFPSRLSRFLTALNNILRNEGVTTLFTSELPELIGGVAKLSLGSISAVSENVVLMQYAELESKLRRKLSVIKIRVSDFDSTVREFDITSKGIQLEQPIGQRDRDAAGNSERQ